MTIDHNTREHIIQLSDRHWRDKVKTSSFQELMQGKEVGHRIADFVDDQCTSLLKLHLDTRFEGNKNGTIRQRSMGDVWIQSNGMYNPVNVKSGLRGMGGNPNIVAMHKLLDYIFCHRIDSYYILIIKFQLEKDKPPIHKTWLIDILDWIEYLSYDAGPGQIMLKEKLFYAKYDSRCSPNSKSISDKVNSLFEMYENGLESNYNQRTAKFNEKKSKLNRFNGTAFKVNQSDMVFVP